MRLPVVILAGGEGRRLGGVAKGLVTLGPDTMLALIRARLDAQAGDIRLNLRPGDRRYDGQGLDILADAPEIAGSGPLAGVLTALDWAATCGYEAVATVAVDTPFLPPDLLARLGEGLGEADAAYAVSNGRRHPVAGLWRVDLAAKLRQALVETGLRRMEAWLDMIDARPVRFAHEPFDPFLNVNDAEQRAEATRVLLNGIQLW